MKKFRPSKPNRVIPSRIRKNGELDILQQLLDFVDSEEPEMVRWLVQIFNQQEHSVTYTELQNAYFNGKLPVSVLEQWQESYATFVQEKLVPQWETAMKSAVFLNSASEISPLPSYYQPSRFLFEDYLKTQSGSLITCLSESQAKSMQAMLGHVLGDKNMSAVEASRFLRPLIGLNEPQVRANKNYYDSMMQNLMENGKSRSEAEKIAQKKSATYAAKQHRYRASMIARTELANAYNQAHFLAVEEAENGGLLEEMVKIVCTSQAERMCPSCGKMEGEAVLLKERFSNGFMAPVFHPNCHCALKFEEKWLFEEFGGKFGSGNKNSEDSSSRGQSTNGTTGGSSGNSTSGNPPLVPTTTNTPLTTTGNSGKINFVEAKTLKEAEDFARDKLGVPHVSYKGCDVVTANEWNKGLTEYFNNFPELKKNFGFVGECHERNKLIKEGIVDHYTQLITGKYPQYSYESVVAEAQKMATKSMKPLAVGRNTMAESMSQDHIFTSKFKGVTVNRDYGKNSDNFITSITEQVTIKSSPEGCTTIRSLLDHEIGHQLDDLLDLRNNPTIKALYDNRSTKEITADLCSYAWNNNNSNLYSEMIAEAWSEYCNNPQPREIAQTIGSLVEELYEQKFG